MAVPRLERLERELQQEIATIVQQELKHPGVGFVTITRVKLSKDLTQATVLFSCLGGEPERTTSQEALERSGPYIHRLIKHRFRLRVIPTVHFEYDASIAGAISTSELLDRIKEDDERRGAA